MDAILFDSEQEAHDEGAKVERWAAANGRGVWVYVPAQHRGKWAVGFPAGYPATGEVVDVNYVEPDETGEREEL